MSNIFNAARQVTDKNVIEGDFIPVSGTEIGQGRFPGDKWARETQPGYNEAVDVVEYVISPNAPVGTNELDATFPTGNVNLTVYSTSINDVGVTGTGCRQVLVLGLDTQYNSLAEVLTLNGQTGATTSNLFIRINDMLTFSAGSVGANDGHLYCTDSTDTATGGIPDARIYDAMQAGDNVSKTMLFTVPNGRIFTPTFLRFQTNATSTKTLELKLFRQVGRLSVFALAQRFYIAIGGGQIDLNTLSPLRPKVDMKITAKRDTGNGTVKLHASFEGLLGRMW